MRGATLSIILAVVLSVSSIPPEAGTGSIPSYYEQLDFDLTAPAARARAVGGFANPAVYRMLPGGELYYFWSGERAKLRSINRWGIFLGTTNFGFGAVYNRPGEPHTDGGKVIDYRLALSLGDRDGSLGIAYGWSAGDTELFGRTRVLQLGAMRRVGRYVSTGLTGTFSLEDDSRSGLAELAVRPLGDERLTLFADMELMGDRRLGDARWSAGAMIEPVPGLAVVGRYFDDERFAVSTTFSFGKVGAATSARFDDSGAREYMLYGVRIGYREKNVFDSYVRRGKVYLSMELTGPVKYRRYRFFDKGHTLLGVLTALDDALGDDRVAGVALNLSGTRISREKAWEVREKLAELQRAGKHVVVFIDNAGMDLYHLASVADRIVMDPDGYIETAGYLIGRTFMKNLLEKLGLGFDEWRLYKYKSAAEALSRENMSDPDREQWLAILEDFYAQVRGDVARSRRVSPETFDSWVNDGIFFPADTALAVGMVDKLGRWEEVKEVIEELEGSEKGYIGPDGLASRAIPSIIWGEKPKIAVVYGLGICAMDEGIKARKLAKIFDELRDDRRVRAVVFRVDSPGGDALASDVVAEALDKCSKKKPVIVSQGDVAGSGGYWISMYGDTIVAGPSTITGSIGVIGGWVWNEGLGEKIGLTSDHVKVGEHADLGFGITIPLLGVRVPDRNLTDEERARVEMYIKLFYREFVGKVAEGRDMSEEEVEKIAQGRVWSGVAGERIGLVDMIGGLDFAVDLAKGAAGLDPGEEVKIVELPEIGWINPAFFRKLSPFPVAGEGEAGLDEVYRRYEEVYLRRLIDARGKPLHMVPPEAISVMSR